MKVQKYFYWGLVFCVLLGCASKSEYLTEDHKDYNSESERYKKNIQDLDKCNQRRTQIRDSIDQIEALLNTNPGDPLVQEKYHTLTVALEKEEDNHRYLTEQTKLYHDSSIFSKEPEKIRNLEERKRREGN